MSSLSFVSRLRAALREQDDLRIVVTGGSGWLGRACLEMLDETLGDDIITRIIVFGSSQGLVRLLSGRQLDVRPLEQLSDLARGPLLIAHFAFLTREKVREGSLSEYVATNLKISEIVEREVQRLQPVGLIMPSSGAATRASVDANPYGKLKFADEGRFTIASQRVGFRFSCPRLFNLSGPFINKVNSYALSSIICDLISGMPIRLLADKLVVRSYVHVSDLMNVCFCDCLFGLEGGPNVFETAGELQIEVGELALLAADVLGYKNHIVERPPVDPEKAPDIYVGDPREWKRRLDRFGIKPTDISSQIRDTEAYLRSVT